MCSVFKTSDMETCEDFARWAQVTQTLELEGAGQGVEKRIMGANTKAFVLHPWDLEPALN
jgi:hypothetical protein